MEESEWEKIRVDYHERMRIAKIEGIKYEKEMLDEIFKHLEITDYDKIMNAELPIDIFTLADFSDDDSNQLISRKWNEPLCYFTDIFKYEQLARKRNEYYLIAGNETLDNRYEEWLDYIAERKFLSGDTSSIIFEENEIKDFEDVIEKIKNKPKKGTRKPKAVKEVVKPKTESEDDEEIGENVFAVDENGQTYRTDEVLKLDDEVDDTYAETPEDYVPFVYVEEEEKPKYTPEENRVNINAAMNAMTVYEQNKKKLEQQDEPQDEWGF
jgi:hypothetical protein